MTIHANSDIGHNHKTHNWEFADAAVRTAHTYATGDVGKEALQLDDSTFWKIIAVASGVATFREVAPTATVQHFRGKYTSSGALITAHPTALDGDYAIVDSGAGTNADEYIWDANEGWIKSTAASAGSTDTLTEGSTNLYFTGARAIASVLTGFTAGAGTVSATDSILQAIQKIVGNVSGLSLFKTISVAGQSDVVADSQTDTLTLAAGTNITITTDASTDTITIAASGGDTTTSEGALINSATAKTTPVDADMFGLMDSAASNVLKKVSWSSIKSELQTFFNSIYVVYSALRGYALGGDSSGYSSEIDGIIFSTETSTNPSVSLVTARYYACGVSSLTNGYILGGITTGAILTSDIEGINFSSETSINPAATLSLAIERVTGVASATAGYALGGYYGLTISADIDGIIFSSEAATNPSSVLTVARFGGAGCSSALVGYCLAGSAGAVSSEIDGITFSTEASTNPSSTLPTARYLCAGVSSTTTGYALGGNNDSIKVSEIDGLLFSTETSINPSATLSVARTSGAGTMNNIKGYVMGGNTGSNTTEIDGLLFSTETATNPSVVLSVARSKASGVQG